MTFRPRRERERHHRARRRLPPQTELLVRAWRLAAVQLGGIERLLDEARAIRAITDGIAVIVEGRNGSNVPSFFRKDVPALD
jgi:hypothetical protein